MNSPSEAASVVEGKSLKAYGREFLSSIYAAVQGLRLYSIDNATVSNATDELHRVVREILDREGVLELRMARDFLFLNDTRLSLELANYAAFSFTIGALNQHQIGSIEITPEVERAEWIPLLTLLLKSQPDEGAPFERFRQWLDAAPVRHIAIGPVVASAAGEEVADQEEDQAREAAKRTYFQSVQVAREVLTDARLGKAVNARRVKRAVQGIVEQVLTDETMMIGMTALREYDEYTFTHCVNVCVLSVIIGQKLGLSRIQLYELGLGALFHDIGKTRIDSEITNKPGRLAPEEWAEMQRHPTQGLLALFSIRGFGEVPYRAMLMAYEHHMKLDLSGYPENHRPRSPTLFSRVVHVADCFDAITSKRPYNQREVPADEVLREMRENRAMGCDPLLVKALINVTGVYPVGMLVILDTHELAVVIAPNPDPKHLDKPIVKVISDSMGTWLADPVVADLSDVDPETDMPRRSVVKTTDPDRYGVNVGEYFI